MEYRKLGKWGVLVSEIGLGSGEGAVGKGLHKFPRDTYVLATKVFFPMGDGPNDQGLSRKHIFE